MAVIKEQAGSKTVPPADAAQAARDVLKAEPVKGDVDLKTWHRDFMKRYPAVRARLAE